MADSKRITIISPVIVLVSIALVASFLLAAVYQITSPIIAQREADTKNAALKVVLPEGSAFTKLDVELIKGVTEVYQAENGAGIVCSTNCKSAQGGEITMMIGVNSVGEITGMSTITHNETAGIGDKVLQDSYYEKLYGLSTVDAVQSTDALSGATKTSNCVKESAQVALEEFAIVNSGNIGPAPDYTYDQKLVNAISKLFPGSSTTALETELKANVKEVYRISDEQGYIVVVEYNSIIAVVAVSNDGTAGAIECIEGTTDSATEIEIRTIAESQFK